MAEDRKSSGFAQANQSEQEIQGDAEQVLEAELETSETAEEVEVELEDADESSHHAGGQDEKIAALQNQLARTMADFDNFRRRTRQEREELQQFATRKLLADLLPVVDNFDRALASAEDNTDEGSLKSGVEMVHRQLLSVLGSFGVMPMDTVGQPFNPNVHEAVMQEPASNEEPGIVLQEFQRGYMLHDKILRPAMVKVSV